MTYFTHISLRNWRNFTKAQVDLERRVFLVGANASGKSNFLDVFRFLHDLVSIGGGFQEAVRRRGGLSVLRCMAARECRMCQFKFKSAMKNLCEHGYTNYNSTRINNATYV